MTMGMRPSGYGRRCPLHRSTQAVYRLFTENGITHPDDMSGIIIRELYKYLWK